MVRPDRDRPSDGIKADQSYLGAEKPGHLGPAAKQAIPTFAVELNHGKIGRVRLPADVSVSSPAGFLETAVASGSAVNTDGWYSQGGFANSRFNHDIDSAER